MVIFAFLGIVSLTVLVHAQTQSGFISIDCGLPENSAYTEKKTGINYISDVTFTESGVSYNISSEYKSETLEQPFLTVRSFPQGMKNCYTLKPAPGDSNILIRASFMYGNYDGQNKPPSFDLILGADVLDSVEFADASTIVYKEIILVTQKYYVDVCLGNKGSGTPFISSLELRPLENSSYPSYQGTALLLYLRFDVGSTADYNETYRFKDDVYDRIWRPYTRSDWVTVSSSMEINPNQNVYVLPSMVMQTAAVAANGSDSLVLERKPIDPTFRLYAYVHMTELDQRQAKNQTRKQDIYVNGELWNYSSPLNLSYLHTITKLGPVVITGEKKLVISIKKTVDSPLPPILNALELYRQTQFLQLLSNQEDVDAIMNIKRKYGVKRNWQGDPCGPVGYLWEGLNCNYIPQYNSTRITSLNLSSSGISREISPYISGLKFIQSLDLSNNNLSGPVPDFLVQLQFLIVLNLSGNNLRGSVPAALRVRGEDGLLSLSVDGNPDLCLSTSCTKKKKKNIVVPVLASFLAILALLVAALSILWILKSRSRGNKNNRPREQKNPSFSYSDVVRITNNFERIVGKGGFGTVYHGNLDDNTQVAVKMLSQSSIQGHKEFQTEVQLLLRVHHKNLTTLVGYCDDGTNMGLIYEFMANGNLESHLLDEGSSSSSSSSSADILSWEERLRIATEAAQGLEYLHSGCKPSIVHRDVKPTNILLNEKFHAKIADFGLSRIFSTETETHLSTTIASTPGYLDPEYYKSNRLTEKSDVYSFGVVLLQIITSKPAFEKSKERIHISQWASSMAAKGDIKNVVDPRLRGDFNMNSVWRAVEVAMTCVSENSAKRPSMNRVVMDLNESLAIETGSKDSIKQMSMNLGFELTPQAR